MWIREFDWLFYRFLSADRKQSRISAHRASLLNLTQRNKTVLFYPLLDIFFFFLQWDHGIFILKQLDYSPSFSTSDSQLYSHTNGGTLKVTKHIRHTLGCLAGLFELEKGIKNASCMGLLSIYFSSFKLWFRTDCKRPSWPRDNCEKTGSTGQVYSIDNFPRGSLVMIEKDRTFSRVQLDCELEISIACALVNYHAIEIESE